MARLSLLLFVVGVAMVAPCHGSWKDIIGGVVKDALVEEGTRDVLDHICNYRVTPRIRNLELYFKGDVWCSGWTNIKGESLTRSRTSVVNKAIADFARKAVAAGLILEEDAAPLLH